MSIARILTAAPFLWLSFVCLQNIDIPKLVEDQQPFLESGRITWDKGSIPILQHFHPAPLQFLDDVWRGTTVTFSPSTLGYDEIAWWHMFTFLNDIGPFVVISMIESCRIGNRFRAAYL
jgi:hypothetical protein